MTGETSPPDEGLPFVAPCREVAASAPFRWLRKGWADMWSAPRQSLTYGTIVVLLSLALASVAVAFGGYRFARPDATTTGAAARLRIAASDGARTLVADVAPGAPGRAGW